MDNTEGGWDAPASSATPRISNAAWAAGIAGLWIAVRGYPGLYHDARLYAAQALHRLDPQALQDDLLFRFGTQDAYSVFSYLHAPLVQYLGLDGGTQVLLALSHLLWIGALLYLAASLFSDWRKQLFSAAAVVLPAGYAHLILGYGEPFLTPRPATEALVMIGLACYLRGRLAWAAAGLSLALLFHPLMALAGWSVAGLLLLTRHPRLALWVLPPVLVAPLAAWAAGIPPFDGLLRPMDAQWAGFVHEFNPVLFLSQWDAQDLGVFVVDTAVCLAALLLAPLRTRLFIAAALTAGLGGVLVNLLAADLLHLELFVQLQLSRLLWITHLAAAVSWTVLAARACDGSGLTPTPSRISHQQTRSQPVAVRYAVLGLAWMAAALMLAHIQTPAAAGFGGGYPEAGGSGLLAQAAISDGYPPLAPLLSLLGLLFVWLSCRADQSSMAQDGDASGRALHEPQRAADAPPLTKRLFLMLLIPPGAVLLFSLPTLLFWLEGQLNAAAALEIAGWKAWGWALIIPLSLLLLALAWRLFLRCRQTLAWGLILLVLFGSLLLRDRRSPRLQRWEEAGFQLFSGLDSQELRGQQVYWDDAHNLALWYGLGTPCYLTWTHRAVAPFFRPAAMEWRRRLHHVAPLWSAPQALSNKIIAPIPSSKADEACRDPQLDALILTQHHPGTRPFQFDGHPFHLLHCR
ncbi:MAG TPA: hypothetical protein VLV83_07700 [Acidobacteriota bacterium]|nr:hypothetical protein [Acidobacteriota bacterium]